MAKRDFLSRACFRGCLSGCLGSVCVLVLFAAFFWTSFLIVETLGVFGISTRPAGLHTTRP